MALSGTVEHATASDGTFSAAGALAWDGTGAHTVTLSGIASAAQGGTGIAYFTAAGPTVARTYTFPDADATILYSGGALGTPSSGTLTNATGLPVGGISATGTPDGTTFLRGDGTWNAASGGATLDGITAATADEAGIASGDFNIVWNWQKTTNSETAFTFGETAAATNGTSTSGVPNQVLLKLTTLAASTMSPFSVYSRAAHVFSVSPSTAQILAAAGTSTAPTYSFAGDASTGMYYVANNELSFAAGGTRLVEAKSTYWYSVVPIWIGGGTAAAPSIREVGSTTGISFSSGVRFSVSGVENSIILAGISQFSKGTADAVSYAMNFRKSRGTVASPTVITTGDDLATISGFGYVGATNTYQEACRITFDSTGAISDSATGIGGIISFLHATVGAEPVTVAQMKSQHIIHSGTSPTITAGGGTNPSIAGKDEAFEVTIGTGGTATSVEVTFANAFTTNPPVCVAMSDTDIVALKCVTTTTKVTITATLAFTAGSIIHVICRGWE